MLQTNRKMLGYMIKKKRMRRTSESASHPLSLFVVD